MAQSAAVATGDLATAAQYNNLRDDVISTTLGHRHDGTNGRVHLTLDFKLRNPANTFSYSFLTSAIVADRNVTLPLLTGNDTFVMEAMVQTLTGKTLTSPTITGTTVTFSDNTNPIFDFTGAAQNFLIRLGRTAANAGVAFTLQSKSNTDVNTTRLTINSGFASATAAWTNIRHTGLALDGSLNANFQDFISVNTLNTHTIPAGTDTFTLIAATQTLTGKTLSASVATGVWTASGVWTIPAVTLGGIVSGGGQQLNNIIIGTVTPLAGSFTTLGTSGASTHSTRVINQTFYKTGIADAIATAVFRVTTTDEVGGADAGSYSCLIDLMVNTNNGVGAFTGNTFAGLYRFIRAMNGTGASGTNSAVTAISTTGPTSTGGGTNTIVSVAVTVVEVNEYNVDVQVNCDYSNDDINTVRVVARVQLIWETFSTAPTMSQQ